MASPDTSSSPSDVALTPPRPGLASFLGFVLFLFFGSGLVSLLADSAILFLHRQDFAIIAGLLVLLMWLVGGYTYFLMGFFPAIPKRIFLPISLFLPVANVAVLPALIYYYEQAVLIAWSLALLQVMLSIYFLQRAQPDRWFHWPLFPGESLNARSFSFANLAGMILATILLLVPALALYTGYSAQLAVRHFTDGFVILRPTGISMQMRKYVRDDGHKITLVPMVHVGDPSFYRELSASIPPESVVLMEGVTDHGNLVPSHINYSRMASAVGGVQQVEAFKPRGKIVPADVDMSSFSPATLNLLKSVMLFHAKGLTPETLSALTQPMPPGFELQLMDELLTQRNRHLLDVLQQRLPTSDDIVIPWGAAHMPGISREILHSGFHLIETREFVAMRFEGVDFGSRK